MRMKVKMIEMAYLSFTNICSALLTTFKTRGFPS